MMPVYKTKRNRVIADELEPDDMFVHVMWLASGHGKYMRQFLGPPRPLTEYQALVDWAVSMADYMEFPIYVVPLRAREVFEPRHVLNALPHLTDQERGKLRGLLVKTMAEVMRDCAEQEVRVAAFEVLEQLGVINHG